MGSYFNRDVTLYDRFARAGKLLSHARRILSALIALALFTGLAAAGPAAADPPPVSAGTVFTRGTVTLAQGGRSATLRVEIADTPEERVLGLMHRAGLPEGAGMLFIYPKSAPRSFWMKNTRIPLSLAYISAAWRIGEVIRMNPPLPGEEARTYPSKRPARYALEVNQGWFERNGFGVGARVSFQENKK